MASICWVTDIHLDCLNLLQLMSFLEKTAQYDAIFATGDLSNGWYLTTHLRLWAQITKKPIYC